MTHLVPRSRRDEGFSLPEILVVIIIIGILAAIAIPRLTSSEDRAAAASTRADARAIAIELETSLPEIVLTAEADIVYNSATKRLSIVQPGTGTPVYATAAKLSPGTIMPPAENGNGNNRMSPNGNYCIAIQNREQISYYSRLGFVSSCLADAEVIGVPGGSGGGGDGDESGGGGGPVLSPKTFLAGDQTSPAVPWRSIVFGNGTFVAVGEAPQYGTSTSGLPNNWNVSNTLPGGVIPTSIAYGGGKFVVTTDSGFYSSADPTTGTWETATDNLPTGGPWRITYGNGRFVAISPSGSGTYLTSQNGTDWTSGNIGGSVTKVAFAASRFLAIQDGVAGSTVAFTSSDGSSWAPVALPNPGEGFWVNVSSAGNSFYITGSNTSTANVATSQDGSSWTVPTLPTSAIWQFAVGGAGVVYLIPSNAPNAVVSLNGGGTWAIHGTITSAPWTAATTDSTGVITVVGNAGWVMSST